MSRSRPLQSTKVIEFDDPAVHAQLESIFLTKSRAEWEAQSSGSNSCVTPVLSMDEALSHDHNLAYGALTVIDGVTHPNPAQRFSSTAALPPSFISARELIDRPAAWKIRSRRMSDYRANLSHLTRPTNERSDASSSHPALELNPRQLLQAADADLEPLPTWIGPGGARVGTGPCSEYPPPPRPDWNTAPHPS